MPEGLYILESTAGTRQADDIIEPLLADRDAQKQRAKPDLNDYVEAAEGTFEAWYIDTDIRGEIIEIQSSTRGIFRAKVTGMEFVSESDGEGGIAVFTRLTVWVPELGQTLGVVI